MRRQTSARHARVRQARFEVGPLPGNKHALTWTLLQWEWCCAPFGAYFGIVAEIRSANYVAYHTELFEDIINSLDFSMICENIMA
jgi:hypothetical protein